MKIQITPVFVMNEITEGFVFGFIKIKRCVSFKMSS